MEKKRIIQIVLMLCVALGAFAVGIELYEPRHCALCEAPQSNAPCLLDLHSGEVAELRISTGELSDDPSTFTFSFMDVLGNTGYRDTGARMCKVTLPQDICVCCQAASAETAARSCKASVKITTPF